MLDKNTVINNYCFINLIGEGGFGKVYRAKHINIQREVAIKVYEIEDKNAFKAFKKGANLLSQLSHPNIITMHDFFIYENYAMMVMELLNPDQLLSQKIGDFVEEDKITEFTNIFINLLSAIRYCHQSKFQELDNSIKVGIYHGDIKPENIFINKGRIKVADFMIPNLEQFLRRKSNLDSDFDPELPDTGLFGTPEYMSPEQEQGVVNEQTDIYSIGVTAFKLLTGFHPYERINKDYKCYERYYDGKCQDPKKFNPYSPKWLNRIIVKCIENDLNVRYSHIAEIERDLRKHIDFNSERKKSNNINTYIENMRIDNNHDIHVEQGNYNENICGNYNENTNKIQKSEIKDIEDDFGSNTPDNNKVSYVVIEDTKYLKKIPNLEIITTVIAVIAILVSACISGLFNTEIREWLGLDSPDNVSKEQNQDKQKSGLTCYEETCNGRDPIDNGCDIGAATITSTVVSFPNYGDEYKNIRLEMRHSDKCNASWAKAKVPVGFVLDLEGKDEKEYVPYKIQDDEIRDPHFTDMMQGNIKLRACVKSPKGESQCTSFINN